MDVPFETLCKEVAGTQKLGIDILNHPSLSDNAGSPNRMALPSKNWLFRWLLCICLTTSVLASSDSFT
jgi:hypothetical protein